MTEYWFARFSPTPQGNGRGWCRSAGRAGGDCRRSSRPRARRRQRTLLRAPRSVRLGIVLFVVCGVIAGGSFFIWAATPRPIQRSRLPGSGRVSKPIVNIGAALGVDKGDLYGSADVRIGPMIGVKDLGISYSEVQPANRLPVHNHHVEDQMFVSSRVRGPTASAPTAIPIKAGDVLGAPAGGQETAHQIINTGKGPLRYYGISTMSLADVCEYPDSGKFGVFSRSTRNPYDKATVRHLDRLGNGLDYWDGEPGQRVKERPNDASYACCRDLPLETWKDASPRGPPRSVMRLGSNGWVPRSTSCRRASRPVPFTATTPLTRCSSCCPARATTGSAIAASRSRPVPASARRRAARPPDFQHRQPRAALHRLFDSGRVRIDAGAGGFHDKDGTFKQGGLLQPLGYWDGEDIGDDK